MTSGDIVARAERMGRKGVDMRTVLLDLEDRLGRPMAPAEHLAFLAGWKASAPERMERARRRDLDTAMRAFPGPRDA